MNVSAVNSSTSSTSHTNSTSAPGMDQTFMTLLLAELKSQDPTAPMDATQMVGQMVSLNQLDQLIQIRQLLSGTAQTGNSNG